ncbi:high-affinity Zn(2+) transporter zrt1 [Lobaria immixta]|nr:high-affinity Zn(2+) transporter zrt1 [Lobaria immixta]
MSSPDFNASSVDLDSADPAQIICYLNAGENDYDGRLGARISALFVILIVSTAVTFFPVLAKRVRWLKIPLYVYLFARYFGAGVIVATAFIHLLDPAYDEIGPASCVGMTGHWADYAWCPAIVLTSVIFIFLLDFGAERYVETKYDIGGGPDVQEAVTGQSDATQLARGDAEVQAAYKKKFSSEGYADEADSLDSDQERSFKQQITAFLILEFGVIFHSVIIGLNLGSVGDEFSTLYPVIVFHQSFEGLGIGARMSAIPFPSDSWLPWILCLAYGLTTPISIAIGIGLRTTYNPGSFTANVVSGILDAMSAGILLYTGLVELLARDFLFNPYRTRDNKRVTFMIVCVLLGTGVMALLGKWA